MSERLVIVIEYDADPHQPERALLDAMAQIHEGARHLNPDHVKVVQVHAAIKESADQVLAVFEP